MSKQLKKRIRGWLGYALAALVAILVIGSFVLQGFNSGDPPSSGTGEEVGTQIDKMPIIYKPSNHIPVGNEFSDYNSVPPTSGPHWEVNWASCGFYDDESEVQDERIVHNLEHGQIVISHNVTTQTEIDALRDITRGLSNRRSWLIVRPYSSLQPGQIAIAAWGWLDEFSEVNANGIQNFYDAHVNNGPESITCLGTSSGMP
ncbi:DUF3105 domain-containing protein [SAR202 cluster bacterium AC-409-J13_OGT_754m]|nr:DUF3105 domain-containing protein [SAR202 cluster bacterium AC-409-J13_OGT_754m]